MNSVRPQTGIFNTRPSLPVRPAASQNNNRNGPLNTYTGLDYTGLDGGLFGRRPSPSFAGSNMAGNNMAGSNLNRQDRFDARARRRYGDWSILDYPAVLLWLEADEEVELAADDSLF